MAREFAVAQILFSLILSPILSSPLAMADAPLIDRVKAFKCEVKTNADDLMKEAHSLIRLSSRVLEKPSESEEPLLSATFKVIFCTEKYDHDLEGVEIIDPIFQDRAAFFKKILLRQPKGDQAKLHKDLNDLQSLRENGNG